MSFLLEVLASSEKVDTANAKKKLPIIMERVMRCKGEMKEYLDNTYSTFCEWPRRNQKLLNDIGLLTKEIEELQGRIEQIVQKDVASGTDELNDLLLELEQSNAALSVIEQMVFVSESFLNIKELRQQVAYKQVATEVVQLEKLLGNLGKSEVTSAIKALKINLLEEKAALTRRMLDVFEESVHLVQTTASGMQLNSIKVKQKKEDLKEALCILDLFHCIANPIKKLNDFVLENICKPIVKDITNIKVENDGDFSILTVAVRKTSTKIPHKEVFAKLVNVIDFLYGCFDFQLSGKHKAVTLIGSELSYNLAEIVIKDCLSEIRPNGDESDRFKGIIEDVKQFESRMVELGIFDADSNPFLDYASNLDELCINKKCDDYLSTAVSYMKKDLHDMVEVNMAEDGRSTSSELLVLSVSRSVLDLLELANKILQGAVNEPETATARLLSTVQSIFYQYSNVVSCHHQRLLQTIPQQVALFRNNCMYLAYQLGLLDVSYKGCFSHIVLPTPPLFANQVHQLRTAGDSTFSSFIEEQVQVMDGELAAYRVPPEQLKHGMDGKLRQCVRQLELLRTVWLKVLPAPVYNKTLGYLLNALCNRLVDAVLAAEDIPADGADVLVEFYKVVLMRGPKLFAEPQEVCLHVESWQKLNDLVYILGARLVEISDRWAEGKGPLTLTFTADELRKLIKALFQNTDFRAAVLNKIHN